jgi:hypothetical protein
MIESLSIITDAIRADLREAFADRVRTIEWFDALPTATGQARQAIMAPAILLGLEQIDHEESDADGSDRIPTRLYLIADCLLPAAIDNAAAQVREFGDSVAAYVWQNRWGLQPEVWRPEALSSQPAQLEPDGAGYILWRVMWEQLAYMGQSYWAGGITPSEIYLGIAPRIGPDHIDDYWRVDALPDFNP